MRCHYKLSKGNVLDESLQPNNVIEWTLEFHACVIQCSKNHEADHHFHV